MNVEVDSVVKVSIRLHDVLYAMDPTTYGSRANSPVLSLQKTDVRTPKRRAVVSSSSSSPSTSSSSLAVSTPPTTAHSDPSSSSSSTSASPPPDPATPQVDVSSSKTSDPMAPSAPAAPSDIGTELVYATPASPPAAGSAPRVESDGLIDDQEWRDDFVPSIVSKKVVSNMSRSHRAPTSHEIKPAESITQPFFMFFLFSIRTNSKRSKGIYC